MLFHTLLLLILLLAMAQHETYKRMRYDEDNDMIAIGRIAHECHYHAANAPAPRHETQQKRDMGGQRSLALGFALKRYRVRF